MNTCWVSIDFELVLACAANFESILVIDFNSIETDVEKVAMGRIQIQFEHETHRHRNWLILLHVLNLVGLRVQTSLDWYDLVSLPALRVGQFYLLADIFDSIDSARSYPKCDTFLGCHKLVVETDNHLLGTSKRVFD